MRHRPDIDGLRGVAVLAVILYHVAPSVLPGGFAGVDVFFVISGFLITRIITADLAAGTFSFPSFYARRLRRIVPAMLVVVLSGLIGAQYWLSPSEIVHYATGALSTLGFVPNIYFWRTTGYFRPMAQETPLIHMWSLGVEEQFYLLFPALMVGLWRVGGRSWWVLAVIGLVSLGLADWASATHPGAAFYLLPSRAWELLLGAAVVGFLRLPFRSPPATRAAGSWIGLSAIILSFLVYDLWSRFPGRLALLPAGGTALLLALGEETAGRVQAWLGSRILVGLGLVSYSLYLWHQPVLVFARARQLEPLGVPTGVVAFGIILALATLTWRFVERPFRDRQIMSTRQVIARTTLAGTVIAVAAGVMIITRGAFGRIAIPPTVARSFSTRTLGYEECRTGSGGFAEEVQECLVGAPGSAPTFLVIGDSHARALIPAFRPPGPFGPAHGAVWSLSACPPLLEWRGTGSVRDASCQLFNEQILARAVAQRVKVVILVARWEWYAHLGRGAGLWSHLKPGVGGSEAAFIRAVQRTAERWAETGIKVVLVRQVPPQRSTPAHIYSLAFAGPDPAEIIRLAAPTMEELQAAQRTEDEAFEWLLEHSAISVIKLDEALCAVDRCSVGNTEESYYFDLHHLSEDGARHVADEFARQLASVGIDLRSDVVANTPLSGHSGEHD